MNDERNRLSSASNLDLTCDCGQDGRVITLKGSCIMRFPKSLALASLIMTGAAALPAHAADPASYTTLPSMTSGWIVT